MTAPYSIVRVQRSGPLNTGFHSAVHRGTFFSIYSRKLDINTPKHTCTHTHTHTAHTNTIYTQHTHMHNLYTCAQAQNLLSLIRPYVRLAAVLKLIDLDFFFYKSFACMKQLS